MKTVEIESGFPGVMLSTHTIEIDESQRQMILLALAHLAIERPGWKMALSETALTMDDGSMFSRFYQLRLARVSNSLPEEPTDETVKQAMGVNREPFPNAEKKEEEG